MNAQVKNSEKKLIKQSVYGIFMLVVLAFILIFSFMQFQNGKIERLENIAYNYHLSVSEKSQSILSAIAEMNLWFKNAYILREKNLL